MDTTATQEVACVTRPRLELVVDERERQRLQELQRYNVLDTAPYVFPLLFRGPNTSLEVTLLSSPPSPSLCFGPLPPYLPSSI